MQWIEKVELIDIGRRPQMGDGRSARRRKVAHTLFVE
jgi:hypothetical protein